MEKFAAFHLPALERDQARHNLLIGQLDANKPHHPTFEMRCWTLGGPGACAVQTAPERGVILGDLDERQCHALADEVHATEFGGAIGPGDTAHWFAGRARQLGLTFDEPIPQSIQVLTAPPVYPGAPGNARLITPDDFDLFAEWTLAFCAEAVPHDPTPTREALAAALAQQRHLIWEVNGQPVSMAARARSTRDGACIGPVYTPPEFRGRGYAGSVTAAVVERIYAEGKTMACLYTDLRNPYSNRCYEKIGFRVVCTSWHYARQGA